MNEYCKVFKKQICQIGVFIMPLQPFFCASSDALVVEDGCVLKCLEIECPFKCKKLAVYDKVKKKCNVTYLYVNENGEVCLRQSHIYFTQCQMTMYVTGLNKCDFFVWSPVGSHLVSLKRDQKFLKSVVAKTTNFYFEHFLPALYIKNSDPNKENNSINI